MEVLGNLENDKRTTVETVDLTKLKKWNLQVWAELN